MASSSSLTMLAVAAAFAFLLSGSSADTREILVGGKQGAWQIPSSESDSLNNWAERARFRVGDSLVWKYNGAKDSVLQVTKEAYSSCNTTNPIAEFSDGVTKVKLDRPGPFFFISGAKGHCQEGQKLVVVVMSPRNSYVAASPAPSPAEHEGPAIAPTSSASGLEAGELVAFVLLLGLGLF